MDDMLSTISVSGYRSLVDLVMPLGRLNVVAGANGSGKSNLYRALQLLAAAASGGTVGRIAAEGGLDSVLWAGPEVPQGAGAQGTVRRRRVSLMLGFASDELGYLVDLGLPQIDPRRTLFARDPEIKREQVFAGPFAKPATVFVDRDRGAVRVRDGGWRPLPHPIAASESILTDVADADATLELLSLRRGLAGWRFYDHFRTDRDAPVRHPQVGTRTRSLAHDGSDLTAAWATAEEAGCADDLSGEVSRAFPGSRVEIAQSDGAFRLRMHQPGLLRPLEAAELSDGTLRYLLLIAALLPAAPAPFIVLNEPESSLHPGLLAPLARLIVRASESSQVLVVTHAAALRAAMEDAGADAVELVSEGFGTRIAGQAPLDQPPWRWPNR
jgi:predicted ATPase